MKKTVAVFLTVLLVYSFAWAEEEEGTKGLSISVGAGFFSQYVDKVTGETIRNRPVVQPYPIVQPYLEVEHAKTGLYVGTWLSYDCKNFEGSSANEADFYLGVRKEVKNVKLDVGYAYVDIKNSRGDFHSFHAIVDFPEIYSIVPYIHVQADKPVHKEVTEGGFAWRAGLKRAVSIKEQPVNLDLSVGGHDGIYGYRPEPVSSGRATISTTFKVFDTVEIIPEVNFQKRFGHQTQSGGISADRFWAGVTVNFPVEFLSGNDNKNEE